MKTKILIISLALITAVSCDPEPTGPESDCHLLPIYKLDYHAIDAPKVFDIRPDSPIEISNGLIEYELFYQWFFLHDDIPTPYPYSEYFIDTIEFLDETMVDVKVFESDFHRIYDFRRDDCQIELESPEGKRHLELTNSGDEVSEQRFAIYDHKMSTLIMDTFLFIEFRTGDFISYEELIKQFVMENPGQYDTISIELVHNKTKE